MNVCIFSIKLPSLPPPWLLDHPRVNFDLHCFHKEDTPPEIYRSRFHELCSHYDGFCRLYTDGSKISDQVASAAVARNSTKTVHLPDKASIFRAEQLHPIYPVECLFIINKTNTNLVIVLAGLSHISPASQQ